MSPFVIMTTFLEPANLSASFHLWDAKKMTPIYSYF